MELSSNSLSNEISKGSVNEALSMRRATMEDALSRSASGRRPDAISDEEIHNGDPILDTYKVTSDAIHGGMGSVWRVHHNGWDVDLAMKRPQPKYFAEGSDDSKEEFIAECENWINLGLHPGIVSCYYVRDISGVPSIFSEWMDGGSLRDRIRDGSIYEGTEQEVQERILRIAIQTARGLRYSHEQGLVHQDVKPGNVLLSKEWDAKVSDFGLAKAQSRLRDGGKPLSFGGTLEYCPREQAEGGEPERWMDLYAFALTVIEMFAGGRSWKTGAEAGEQAAEILGNCRVSCPAALAEALVAWLRHPAGENASESNAFGPNASEGNAGENTAGDVLFGEVERVLLKVYWDVTGMKYPDDRTSSADATSDLLNNYALSFLDLGFPEHAEQLLEEAVHRQNNARNPVFNYALLRWRSGEITDAECVAFLTEHLGDRDDSISEIKRERGYEDGLCRVTTDASVSTYNLKSLMKPMAFDVRAAKHGNYLGVIRARDWSDPNNLFSVFACDENGIADSEIMQTETEGDSTCFSVIDDSVLVFTNEGVLFYHFGVGAPYHTIQENGAYWNKHIVETDDSQIIVLTKESGGEKYRYRVEFYGNLAQLVEEKESRRTEIEISDEIDNVYWNVGKLFLIGFDSVIVLDGQLKELANIPIPSIGQAILKNNKVYIMTGNATLSLDTGTLEKETIAASRNYANGRSDVSADGKHVIAFGDSRIKIYDTELHRCVADWHEDRFREWEKVVVFAGSADTFTLHVKNKVYDQSTHGHHPEYIYETYRIPAPGVPCAWNLSKIQSFSERLEAEKAFRKLLGDARDALDAGNIPACLRLLEAGYEMKGFEQNSELRKLSEAAGKGRDITGIRYIQKVVSAYELSSGEKAVGLAGNGSVLTYCGVEVARRPGGSQRSEDFPQPEGDRLAEYRLVDWETGEIRAVYPAADNSTFACVSRDGSLAAAFENVTQESFTVLKMHLTDGGSERVVVPVHAEPDQIHAATDGERILVFSGHHCVLIGSDGEYRIAEAESESMAFGCFSADGRYFARAGISSYSSGSEVMGQGVTVIRTEGLPEDRETVYSAEAYGLSGLDVNDEGMALAFAIVFFPDAAGFAVRSSGISAGVGFGVNSGTSAGISSGIGGEGKFEASSFTPDGSGFVAVGDGGSLALFLPRSDDDYLIEVQDTDPRKGIVYEKPVKSMRIQPHERVSGASAISTDGRILFNGNGTAFLDAGGDLWVIDYRYSADERRPFLRPSYGKMTQTDEYQREISKAARPELFAPDNKSKREGKKGILERLFGWMR